MWVNVRGRTIAARKGEIRDLATHQEEGPISTPARHYTSAPAVVIVPGMSDQMVCARCAYL